MKIYHECKKNLFNVNLFKSGMQFLHCITMRFESLSCQRKCKLQLKFRKSWKFLYLIFNLVELISCFLNQEYQYVY
ncbi:UNVERIFIED_CONTAM: hypothetical protein RMT77_019265 [Armadillidium vulgare]|nr:hypothetical protein Avbf_11294 [Armadillidium vulgare]RXG55054.1 hypothetical protein Avbf_17878 [Armadillidium vulgare]RXG58588.1 hypothetical protein Avbf_18459 [Armadillidium vulgare]